MYSDFKVEGEACPVGRGVGSNTIMDEKPIASKNVTGDVVLAPLREGKVQGVTLSVLTFWEKATVEEIPIAGRLIRGGGQKEGGGWVR